MTHRFRQATRQRIAKVALAALVTPLLIGGLSSGASAAKLNESCKRKDLFEVEKVTNKTTKKVTYIRCMVKKGTSLHAKSPKFAWQKVTKAQFAYGYTTSSSAIRMDGSSTVYPLMAVTAKYFEATTSGKVNISIGISGTGGGMEKFCKGEIDMANASRAMTATEAATCAKAGVTFTEVLVANDGLAVVVNPKNPLTCITTDQLKTMWKPATGKSGPGSAKTWADAIPGNTSGDLKLYGAGSDSGTFDSFNTFVHNSSSTSRTDFQATENDNVTVKGVAADAAAIGYYGLSYAEENKKLNKALELDKGAGCVAATKANVQSGTYAMARPLFTYVKNTSASKPIIKQFLRFYLDNSSIIGNDALFVPLTKGQRGTAFTKVNGL
jgi:phosphate transport system substrate-binding protein